MSTLQLSLFKGFGRSLFVAGLSAVWSLAALADGSANDGKTVSVPAAHEVVSTVTSDMMTIIKSGETALKSDPESYFNEIEKTLERNVAFGFIARGVMSSYWKDASEDQRKRFTEVFTKSMVRTLGKGMANYSDLDIVTLQPKNAQSNARRIAVDQEVKGGDKVHKVSYTMARKPSGPWMVTNVILNGVNLGGVFRDQFIQGVRQHGSIDAAITNWVVDDDDKKEA